MDRNISPHSINSMTHMSLSARRAWIEIIHPRQKSDDRYVALRKESVDRNLSMGLDGRFKLVALRKESVDRNLCTGTACQRRAVALRKESVDRNSTKFYIDMRESMSLSARRAWIEI